MSADARDAAAAIAFVALYVALVFWLTSWAIKETPHE